MSTSTQPIVVKKVKKVVGGHHGGAWKVAFADFVTAMMAFFLLLWLLSSTTEAQKAAIAGYFQNPSMIDGASGTSPSVIDLEGSAIQRGDGEEINRFQSNMSDEELEEKLRELDRKRLEDLKSRLEQEIERNPTLKAFKEQLKLDITDEGLRIQIIDQDGRPMFDSGAAELKPYSKAVFDALAKLINSVPNKISISGHTDARPFRRADGYSNWELSADRANASRRELIRAGVPEDKIARVVGHGDKVLYDKENPYSPVNRRISIVVLNREAEQALMGEANSPTAQVGSRHDVEALRSRGLRPLPVVRGEIQRAPVARGGIQRH